MALSVEAIRAEMERVDETRKALKALRDEIDDQITDEFIREAILAKVNGVEAAVFNKKEEAFTPDFKILVAGADGSGKTSLIRRYFAHSFAAAPDRMDAEYRKAPGERIEKCVSIDGKQVKLSVARVGGNLTPQLAQWADVLIIVYSMRDVASFEYAFTFFNKIVRYNQEIPVLLVSTGDDEHGSRVIPVIEGRRLSHDMHNAPFFEISAVTGSHIKDVFQEAVKLAQKGRPGSGSPDVRSRREKFIKMGMKVELKDKGKAKQLDGMLRGITHLPRPFRPMPAKQGWVHRQTEGVVREWKKKYLVLARGQLMYYPSMLDYFKDENGKVIQLKHCTVKPMAGGPMRGGMQAGTSTAIVPVSGLTHVLSKSVPAIQHSHTAGSNTDISNATNMDYLGVAGESELGEGIGGHSSDGFDDKDDRDDRRISKDKKKVAKPQHRRKSSITKVTSSQLPVDNDFTLDEPVSPGHVDPQAAFQIVSLDGRSWTFMTPSVDEAQSWMQMIQDQVMEALKGLYTTKSTAMVGARLRDELSSIKTTNGNTECAECGSPGPEWASINLGILICIECSGIHRNLGVHYSRVRSLALDDWHESTVQVMTSIGNTLANSVWEHTPVEGRTKPTPTSDRATRELWIRSKYVEKAFIERLKDADSGDMDQMQTLLRAAIEADDRLQLYLLCAHLLGENDQAAVNKSVASLGTVLHTACEKGSLFATQLFLWMGADPTLKRDSDGLVPVDVIVSSERSVLVELLETADVTLQKRGAH